MTTRERFEKILTDSTVSKEDAIKIMDIAIPLIDEEYNIAWDRPAEEYSRNVYAAVFGGTIKQVAVDWLDKDLWV